VSLYGCIEAGGTKFVVGCGSGPDDLEVATFPTGDPIATTTTVINWLRERAGGGRLRSVGIASFGPVDLDPQSPRHGYITATPKLDWRNFDLKGTVERALEVPAGFDTDVNAAALGEARWGAAQGLTDFVYLTIGTGIGGGAMVNGKLLHGLMHPEMGHMRVPHDLAADPFPGCCPYHGDCWEGLASGTAMAMRWNASGQQLPPGHPAWALEARYLALGLTTLVCTLSPRRIIMGGGVMQQAALFPLVRADLLHLLHGYIQVDALLQQIDHYVVPPRLGNRAGVLGALALAEAAAPV
jgi:fructokinase